MSLGLGSSGSRAARPEPMIANKTDADDALRRFRLSTVTLRTNATAISFDRGAEQTWNPTVGMNLDLSPRYWVSDKLSLALGIDLSGDLTENDLTTYRNEVWLGDTRAVLIARDFATIPGIDVTMSASLGVTLPTSKWSIGEGLIMSVGPSIRLGRAFPDVLGGLNIGYSARFAKNFHRYTTSELATPRIPGCLPGAAANCDSFTHTGVRNVSYRLAHGLDVARREGIGDPVAREAAEGGGVGGAGLAVRGLQVRAPPLVYRAEPARAGIAAKQRVEQGGDVGHPAALARAQPGALATRPAAAGPP